MIESIMIKMANKYNILFNHVPDKKFSKKKKRKTDPMNQQE